MMNYKNSKVKFIENHICDNGGPLQTISIFIDNYNGKKLSNINNISELEKTINELIKDLQGTFLPPTNINIYNAYLHVHWHFPDGFTFDDVGDFLPVLDNFMNYVNTFNFCEAKLDMAYFHNNKSGSITKSRRDKTKKLLGIKSKAVNLVNVGNIKKDDINFIKFDFPKNQGQINQDISIENNSKLDL